MPATLVGLLIFVTLLAPGLCYVARARVSRPVQKPSVLGEAARLVLVSAVSDVFAIGVFGVLRSAAPSVTPDIGRLIREGASYVRQDYLPIALWSVALLGLACLVAVLGAALRDTGRVQALLATPAMTWLLRPAGGLGREPAWWVLFAARPERIHVGCALDDGSYLSGYVSSFSAESDETADRELVLADEVTFRAAGAEESVPLETTAVVVSARRLQYLTVTYVEEKVAG